MSVFNVMSPFAAPDQKQMLLNRLMDQYGQAARRASGIGQLAGGPSLSQGPARGLALFHPLGAAAPHGPTVVHLATPYKPVQGGS